MRKYSKEQEKRIAKKTKGKPVSNSGATSFNKGDVDAGLFLIEAKTKVTASNSFTVKKDQIEKLKQETFGMGKPFWAFCFNFGLENNEDLYIINEQLFLQLKKLLEENE